MKRKSNLQEIDPAEKCPCESGKKYAVCCKLKNIQYSRSLSGKLYKFIPLTPESIEVLKHEEAQFRSIFGRKPSSGDPIMIGQYLYGEEEFDLMMVEAMLSANIGREFIYAYMKTGFILGKESPASKSDWAEYSDAIDEYFYLKDINDDPVDFFVSDPSYKKPIEEGLIVIGHLLHREFKRPKGRNNEVSLASRLICGFCLAKTARILKSILALAEKRHSGEIPTLARSAFELAIILRYVQANEGKARQYIANKFVGSERYGFEELGNGKLNKRRIVDNLTGEKFNVLTISGMLSAAYSSDDLLHSLYDFLSSYAHADIRNLQDYVNYKGFTYRDMAYRDEGFLLCLLICLLVLVSAIPYVSKRTAIDIKRAVKIQVSKVGDLVVNDNYLSAAVKGLSLRLIAQMDQM